MILFTLSYQTMCPVWEFFYPFQQYTKKHLTLHHSSIGLYNITVFSTTNYPFPLNKLVILDIECIYLPICNK
jgi:hypothetical protein